MDAEPSVRNSAKPQSPTVMITSVSGQKASEIMKLLDLVAVLKSQGETHFDLASIVKQTSEAYLHVARVIPQQSSTQRRGMGGMAGAMVQISWPTLDSYQVMGMSRQGQDPLTPTDWLGYLICTQAAELGEIPLPTLDNAADPAEKPKPSTEPNK